jgi:uncharacterized membrane protein
VERSRIKIIRVVLKMSVPIMLGAVGGFLYYNFIGCNGSCPISGNPYVSTVYGAAIGAILINWKQNINFLIKGESDEEEHQ